MSKLCVREPVCSHVDVDHLLLGDHDETVTYNYIVFARGSPDIVVLGQLGVRNNIICDSRLVINLNRTCELQFAGLKQMLVMRPSPDSELASTSHRSALGAVTLQVE
jgi:hypothetical protein